MSGNIGEGIQYELIFDTSTYASHRRNHVVNYTGVDYTCETTDGATAYSLTRGVSFAGLAFIDFPYVEMSAALTDPYDGTNLSIPYPGGDSLPDTTAGISTADMITVLHRCRTFAIPGSTVAAGVPIIIVDNEADHDAANTHDGMVEAADIAGPTQDEVDGAFGITESGFTVPGTHADHVGTWSQNDGHYTGLHEAVWVSLWR